MIAFLPTVVQLQSFAALFLVAAAFLAIGAAIGGRKRMAEADLLVGWAAVALAFTVAGTLSRVPFRSLAVATAVAGVLALVVVAGRDRRLLPPGAGRMLALFLPLFAAIAAMHPSQWDDFAQWLPNARYLVDTDGFPRLGGPAGDSLLPAYPYTMPLVVYLTSRMAGHFAELAGAQLNVLLLASFALLMARLAAAAGDPHPRGDEAPGWRIGAAAALGATLLCPTFVVNLALTNYADTATAAALAFAAIAGWRRLEAGDEARPARGEWVQFALLLGLLLLLKQANLVLAAFLLCGIGLAALRRPGGDRRFLLMLGLAAIPGLAAYMVWRRYVAAEIGGGDLAVQPFAAWHWEVMPQMFRSMARLAGQKIGFFGLALALTVVGVATLFRPSSPLERLCLVFATVFVGYTAFLAFAYVAIFFPWEGARAASYWRYNTHLGLFATAIAVCFLAAAWQRWGTSQPRRLRLAGIAGAAAIVLVLTAPVALANRLRFDLQPVKVYMREIAPEMRTLLPAEARLVVVDPRGDGFYALFLEYLLGGGRQVAASLNAFTATDPDAVRQGIDAAGATHAWLNTQSPATRAIFPGLAEGASHLLERTPDGWRLVRSWPFRGFSDPMNVPK